MTIDLQDLVWVENMQMLLQTSACVNPLLVFGN